MTESPAPVPPESVARRVGNLDPADPIGSYLRAGRGIRAGIESVLGPEWSWEGKRVLDFGCASGRVLRHFLEEASTVAEFHGCDTDGPGIEWLRSNLSPPLHPAHSRPDPPLPYESQSFDLIYAISVFTHLYWNWSAWLLEMHRLLTDDGILIATILGPGMSDQIAGEPWDEDRIGMNVLGLGGSGWRLTEVLHSEWWLRAHWGRAFDILTLHQAGFSETAAGHGVAKMRRRDVSLTEADLEALEPDEPREAVALQHNVEQLFRGSPRVLAIVHSRSWRITRPLRGLADRARRLKAKIT